MRGEKDMDATMVLDAGWECAGTAAGTLGGPAALAAQARLDWIPADVPGTVASALRAAGRPVDRGALDSQDWWFRCRFRGPGGARRIRFAGMATLADVWLNGRHVLTAANMHRSHAVDVGDLSGDCELVVRCAALSPVLAQRRPRPRWKTYLVESQQLRWIRTSLLGRIPGWADVPPVVGLWRGVEALSLDGSTPTDVRLQARCHADGGGTVEARFTVPRAGAEPSLAHGGARLVVGGVTAPLEWRETDAGLSWDGTVTLAQVERWWPHTHGAQPRYEVVADLGDRRYHLGSVGFRTLDVDREGGGFQVIVNGLPVFCRGAVWFPPDPVSPGGDEEGQGRLLEMAREAGLNMVRVPGTTVFPAPSFFDRCDELGILVWQDCMFAFMDPPDDEAFRAEFVAEVRDALAGMDGHPSVTVVCGNQEVEEIAAMLGLPTDRRATPLFDKVLADVVAEELPDAIYVPSNPAIGEPPFRMDRGICQYFGIGGYMRPLEDARRSGVRFAAECLAFASPPEPVSVDERGDGAFRAGHDPEWKRGVHRDAHRSWDMDDVRAFYVNELFGVDPLRARYEDAERSLELGRAASAVLMDAVFSEWRRPGSPCGGGLVLGLSDLRPGAGWGLVDSAGRPKSPWYALRRAMAPLAVLAVDEGLNGLDLHVVNDGPEPVAAQLEVALVARGAAIVERAEVAIDVPAHGSVSVGAEEVLGAWRDVTYAYRFSPPAHDAVVATVRGRDGDNDDEVLAEVVHLPLGQARPQEPDVGLAATARRDGSGRWWLDVRTQRLAQWVTIRVEGFVAADSWFHLAPGASRSVELWPDPAARRGVPGGGELEAVPRGTVQALNAIAAAPVVAGEAAR